MPLSNRRNLRQTAGPSPAAASPEQQSARKAACQLFVAWMDSGVYGNPRSRRAGLLTFEHRLPEA
jgi:hypothetical protein